VYNYYTHYKVKALYYRSTGLLLYQQELCRGWMTCLKIKINEFVCLPDPVYFKAFGPYLECTVATAMIHILPEPTGITLKRNISYVQPQSSLGNEYTVCISFPEYSQWLVITTYSISVKEKAIFLYFIHIYKDTGACIQSLDQYKIQAGFICL
jgi:hypothetical protein